MSLLRFLNKYKRPLAFYALFVVAISLLPRLSFLDNTFSFLLAFTYMLTVPSIFDKEGNLFSFELKPFLKGSAVGIAFILAYLSIYMLYGFYSGRSLKIKDFGYMVLFFQFFLVSLPEEAFFRGFLQRAFGNDLFAVVFVSVLFSLAHLASACVWEKGHSVCLQNALTFFPSLVMGYLYMWTGTIWTSVFFHFLANISYIYLVMS